MHQAWRLDEWISKTAWPVLLGNTLVVCVGCSSALASREVSEALEDGGLEG